MIPRGTIDIGWRDLLFGLLACGQQTSPVAGQTRVESIWSPAGDSLACLSVRSGFDLLLQALALPPGSEVLVSAITIRDMTRLLEYHSLVPISVDLDIPTLAVDCESLARTVRPQTKALLVAHLFGSRMPMEPMIRFAQQHGLFVIEDCAQAYDGSTYRGHPASDVSLFSFGPIKTQTALGGGLLRFKDRNLLGRVRALQARYPRQHRLAYGQRLLKYSVIKALANRVVLQLLVTLCRWRGTDHDQLLRTCVQGFAGGDLIAKLRYQPSLPLLRLLGRRLQHVDPTRIEQRIAFARRLLACLPATRRPGGQATHHTYWVLPIQNPNPDALTRQLWQQGFDATRGASSLYVVQPPPDRPEQTPVKAIQAMAQVLYLPIQPTLSAQDAQRMAQVVRQFEATQQPLETLFAPENEMVQSIRQVNK
jgi:perosamine synthetase